MVKRSGSKRSLSKSSSKKKSRNSERDFKKLIFDGETYLLNDTVNIFEENDSDAYARILRIYSQKKGQVYLSVRWFYKPRDIYGDSIPPHISQNELFESDNINEISALSIIKKANILSIQEYCKLPPSDSQAIFYRSTYSVKTETVQPLIEYQDLDIQNSMVYFNIYNKT